MKKQADLTPDRSKKDGVFHYLVVYGLIVDILFKINTNYARFC